MHGMNEIYGILDLIDEKGKTHPFNIAIQDECGSITYSELLLYSTRFAHWLKKNISGNSLIALLLHPSKECFIAIIAILRSGAAYVPIDVNYPKERKIQILETCRPSLLLTVSEEKDLESLFQGTIFFMDKFYEVIEKENFSFLPLRPVKSDLAYIIFTSGSSGIPKGVEIEYESLSYLHAAVQKVIPLNQNHKLFQFASIAFDASVVDWVAALTQGATLCCLGKKDKRFFLKKEFNHFKATIVALPPTLAGILEPTDFPSLEILIVAGEPCHEKVIQKWKNKVRLLNFYGPTEATVWSTFFYHSSESGCPPSTIGKGIPGISTYVINEHNEICRFGEVGELLLEGKTLARGYFNDPLSTHKSFIFLPHLSPNRLYRTGDFVRLLPDGNLEYIGRKDLQVKIQGNRIELGEIENILNQHPRIEKSVIQLYERNKRQFLVGFYILNDNSAQDNNLRNFLESKVPSYMMPTKLIQLKEFPLNVHGKVDKQKLYEYFISYDDKKNNTKYFRYPANEIELQILKVWLKVLDKQIIQNSEDFFSLGGDSTLAIQLCLELESALGCSIDYSLPYKARTIAEQSHYLSPNMHKVSRLPVTLLSKSKNPKNPKIFLVHPAGGLSIPYFSLGKCLENFTLFGINSPYLGNKKKHFQDVKSMASQYIRFIKKLQKKGPYIIGGWSFGGNVAIEIGKQLYENQNEIKSIVLFDSFNYSSYDLSKYQSRNIKEVIFKKNSLLTPEELEILSFEFENNEKIGMQYRPNDTIPFQVLLLKSEEIEEAFAQFQALPDNGWESFIKNSFHIEKIPCKHANMFEPQHAEYLAQNIKKHFCQ